ncbi:MAG TPA: FTR1 family protein [Bacillales bacterium]|nr:FTR1 family protein [Bacillales bacterium]
MRALLKLSVIGLVVLSFVQPVWAAAGERLVPIVEQAVAEAEEGEISEVAGKLEVFHENWEEVEGQIREEAPKSYEEIEAAYARAEALVNSSDPKPAEVKEAVEALEEAVEGYAAGGTETSQEETPGAKALLGLAYELKEAQELIGEGNWGEAAEEYEEFHAGWERIEDSIRSANIEAYERIESAMGLVSAALHADPPKAEQATESLGKLIESIEQYANGEVSGTEGTEGRNIGTLVHILDEAQTAVAAGNAEKAAEEMEEFIHVWPTVEGQVKTQSAEAYTATENHMTEALSLLSSNPPQMEKAADVISGMKAQLRPLAVETDYSFWDAAIILLREGLEIILILAALLAFLNKTNNSNKRPWVWGGAGAGVIASVALAFGLTSLLSAAAAGADRELIEGVTGLIAVVVMFTVGAWLHNKSNIGSWNQYIKDKAGTALARGSLWSLAGVAFLTVVREGAETIIFYLGMAADISASQLMLGIAVALVILLGIGFAIIKFSIKLPIQALFLTITVLIYYLAFKFTGESLHALQVVDKISAHPMGGLPSVSWLGVYPTWETMIAQVLLLALIAGQTWLARRRQTVARETTETSERVNQAIEGNR